MELEKIYFIINIHTDELYVGKTKKSLRERFLGHFRGTTKFDTYCKETGKENWKIFLIEELPNATLKEVQEREKYWVLKLDTLKNGWNSILPGEFPEQTQESINKMATKIQNLWDNGHYDNRINGMKGMAGELNPCYNKEYSEEWRKEQSNRLTKYYEENPMEQETKNKISESLIRYNQDDNVREMKSQNQIRYYKEHPEAREVISNRVSGENHPMYGTTWPKEQKETHSNFMKEWYKNNKHPGMKSIIQLSSDYKFIAQFESAQEAEDVTCIKKGNIWNGLNKKTKKGERIKAGGFLWMYYEDYINIIGGAYI